MIDIAIVILNWNGKKHLEKFLPSVIENSNFPSTKIYIIDNGSTDNSVAYLTQNFNEIELIKLDKNYGFAEGYNKGLQKIKAKYYIILNSDVEVVNNWLGPLFDRIEKNQEIAACMPKILSYNNKNYFEYAGAAGGFIDKYGYPFCQGRILNSIEIDSGQYNQAKPIFWATGACLVVRSQVFHDSGGFDKNFFAHMEEIDLCWRLKNFGYKIYYEPDSTIFHFGGGTLPKSHPKKTFLNFRNNYYLLYKNLNTLKFLKTYFIRIIFDFASFLLFLFEGKIKDACSVPRAHFAFWISINKLRLKKIKQKNKIIKRNHQEIYQRSIIVKFYLNKIKKFSDLKFN